ncbi:tRNA (adenosine(37)-N6)-threonylcarbamoyltransferase complex transferase subunit TsaD [Miniphocaeibacter halophilus]|uniref:tRNA (Adenosine(37)-N6)-threonylcarbamoyltransferase complex transferase subunit TsaD n=1 Tax=Miniphocaeibacter halophilus TaxID=2931922 RepID=A0AC61MSR3_9FIRM|nr:tRNA (adenosine(37)-N6)-threonylcarbamoyltransferase complex transferase subunit TsaD [Miniphocaeibacter halophilus]QQK07844.1 tRNA (adenosine(37)-N6)-threonylcarbamoyltransferase complex transferase subunit TsaD [Miniphocaeibacter halophilus]
MKELKILAIETSCDETSVAVIKNGREIMSNIISSQISTHRIFGGVVPEIASRMHLENINLIIKEALEEAKIGFEDIDLVACTKGPGLIGALLVGISSAKAISFALDIPLVGVNHMEGHICANYLVHKDLEPPFIGLIVSGGHTYLVQVNSYTDFEIIGRTRDDAAGESFDKIARALGLAYPGGPEIDAQAKKGNPEAIDFPRVIIDKKTYDFSFSGLKTSVLNYINNQKQKNIELNIPDICASFQQAVLDVLIEKSYRLLKEKNMNKFVISGGVAANSKLIEMAEKMGEENNIKVYYPSKILSTDNAAMIGCAAYYDYINGKRDELSLKVYPNLELGQ